MSCGGGASSGSRGSTDTTSATIASARSQPARSRRPSAVCSTGGSRRPSSSAIARTSTRSPRSLPSTSRRPGWRSAPASMFERAAAVAARVLASAEATRHLSRALAILAEFPGEPRPRRSSSSACCSSCRGCSLRSRVMPHVDRRRPSSGRGLLPRTWARSSMSVCAQRSVGGARCRRGGGSGR